MLPPTLSPYRLPTHYAPSLPLPLLSFSQDAKRLPLMKENNRIAPVTSIGIAAERITGDPDTDTQAIDDQSRQP